MLDCSDYGDANIYVYKIVIREYGDKVILYFFKEGVKF